MVFPKVIMAFTCIGICFAQAQSKGKHDIFVSSAAIQNLYRNCANKVNIDVPDLCSDYNPTCTVTDADIQQSTDYKRKFLIVPRGNKCNLSVFNHTGENPTLLGNILFNVIDPPKPNIEVLLNGQKLSSSSLASKGSFITIKITPSPEFATNMTQDAKYSIGQVSFFAQLSCFAVTKVGGFDATNMEVGEGIRIPIPSGAFEGPSGVKVFMEISDIYRINFKGEKITDQRMSLYEKTVTFLTR